MKTILRAFILLSILTLFSCDLLTGGTGGDLADIPESGAEVTPGNEEEAKNLYLEVSEALYDKVDPLQEKAEKGIRPKSSPGDISHTFDTISGNGLTMSGKVEGTVLSEMPDDITTATSGSFKNTIEPLAKVIV